MFGLLSKSYLTPQQHPADDQRFACYMTFDVKIELRQKDRSAVRGLENKAPATTTFASIVPLETACLALTIADLDNLRNTLVMCSMRISLHQLLRQYDQYSDQILDQTHTIAH